MLQAPLRHARKHGTAVYVRYEAAANARRSRTRRSRTRRHRPFRHTGSVETTPETMKNASHARLPPNAKKMPDAHTCHRCCSPVSAAQRNAMRFLRDYGAAPFALPLSRLRYNRRPSTPPHRIDVHTEIHQQYPRAQPDIVMCGKGASRYASTRKRARRHECRGAICAAKSAGTMDSSVF